MDLIQIERVVCVLCPIFESLTIQFPLWKMVYHIGCESHEIDQLIRVMEHSVSGVNSVCFLQVLKWHVRKSIQNLVWKWEIMN